MPRLRVKREYARVAEKRNETGYSGQDCDECPGRRICVAEYDAGCDNSAVLKDVFPCGLRPSRRLRVSMV